MAALLGVAWMSFIGFFALALQGDCQAELDAMRRLAYTRLLLPADGVKLAGPDGVPFGNYRIARSIAVCFPDQLDGTRLKLPAGQWPDDFSNSLTWRVFEMQSRTHGGHPDANWPYPFNSAAGECVYSQVLRLRAQADASLSDQYCSTAWWPPLRSWLIEGVLPAAGLLTVVWLWVRRRRESRELEP